jgi:V/A-type H+/Na+-transporting ATPase subunit E
MAIEDILKALDDQACAECDQIAADAKSEADRIMAEAQEQADRIKSQRMARVQGSVEPKAQQMVNAARLANKRDIEAVRMRAVDSVFDEALERLKGVRSDPQRYEPLLKGLLKEAAQNSNGDSSAVVDPADETLARDLARDLELTCTIEAAATPYGGVTVTSCAGRVAHRNTLEDRLEQVRSTSRAAVAEMLFA